VPKDFILTAQEMKPLATGRGSCLASDRITVDGRPVGFMYREKGDSEFDSGWRFLAGDESDDYTSDPAHFELYDVNTIANYDPTIITHLDAPIGFAYARDATSGKLVPVNQ